MKLTPWFVNGEKPVRPGVYERQQFSLWPQVFSYWGGKSFGYLGSTPDEAVRAFAQSGGRASYHQNRPWRGLAEEPKQ